MPTTDGSDAQPGIPETRSEKSATRCSRSLLPDAVAVDEREEDARRDEGAGGRADDLADRGAPGGLGGLCGGGEGEKRLHGAMLHGLT